MTHLDNGAVVEIKQSHTSVVKVLATQLVVCVTAPHVDATGSRYGGAMIGPCGDISDLLLNA